MIIVSMMVVMKMLSFSEGINMCDDNVKVNIYDDIMDDGVVVNIDDEIVKRLLILMMIQCSGCSN